jgi:fermentation-respiration switch protein FrsA (DUF1100 family)
MTVAIGSLLATGYHVLRGLAIALAGVWLVALALLWIFQRQVLYMAPKEPAGPPPAGYRAVRIKTEDGLRLTAWHRAADAGQPTLVLFAAQGASLPAMADWSQSLAEAGMGLLLASYRGFDGNPGSPSEEGLYRDGRAALAWLSDHGEACPVLAGLSLGTGVAAEMAVEAARRADARPGALGPRALILLSPYESIPAVAAPRYPMFPVRLLARDRFDTLGKIAGSRLPLLVIHGELDEIVPYAQGLAVFAAASAPKQLFTLAGTGHDFPAVAALPAIRTFLATACAGAAGNTSPGDMSPGDISPAPDMR